MKITMFARLALSTALVATTVQPWSTAQAGSSPSRQQGNVDAPTMSNADIDVVIPPLPASWPVGARDAQFRGAACDTDDTPARARAKGDKADEVLPTLGFTSTVLPQPLLAVRRAPFLTRRDVLAATYTLESSGYVVKLTLTAEGSEAASAYTTAHNGECIALVAGGKVIWSPSLTSPVNSGVFLLSGSFTVSEAQAIVDLFSN